MISYLNTPRLCRKYVSLNIACTSAKYSTPQAVKKKMSFKKKLTTTVDTKGPRYSGSSARKPSLALRGFSRPAASLKLDVDGYSDSQSAAKSSDLSEEDRLIVERLTFNVGGTVFYALKSTFIFSNSSPIKVSKMLREGLCLTS